MTESRKIPITRPLFDGAEIDQLRKVLDSGWVVQGPMVAAFEKAFAAYTGIPHAVATTSCTTALHLALIAAGVRPGDEVALPAFTFVATANAVEYVGARPVFCDVDLDTFNVDPAALRAALGPRTKAAIPVHLFGLACDVDAVLAACAAAGIPAVEDAACAVGAFWRGRHVGGFGFAGCFSYHPRKAITTGEGGMITAQDAAVVERLRSLRDHGARKSDLARHAAGGFLLPEFDEVGYNYRMTDIQGAVGVEQMKKLAGILERRRAVAAEYDRRLAGVPWLIPPRTPDGCVHGYQSYVTRIVAPDSGRADLENVARLNTFRNRLMTDLEAEGISTRQGTHAVHPLGYYRRKYGLREEDFPRAWVADQTTLTLPVYVQMTEADIERVVERVKAIGARTWEAQRPAASTGAALGESAVAPAATAAVAARPAESGRARKRVLVAGAGGFIGRRFVAACAEEFTITALVRRPERTPVAGIEYRVVDLARPIEAAELPRDGVDAIVHLAQCNKYRLYPEAADEVMAVNVGSVLGLANWARTAGCGHFVFASTAGFNPPGVERADDDAPLEPESFYTRTKAIAETMLGDFGRWFALAIVRPYTIYGPGQEGRLIPCIVDKVRRGEPVILEGDAEGMRLSPLFVDDAVEALRRIVRGKVGGRMNLAGDEVVSVRRIAVEVAAAAGGRVVFEPRAEPKDKRLTGANGRLAGLMQGRALTSFSTGMAATVHGARECAATTAR